LDFPDFFNTKISIRRPITDYRKVRVIVGLVIRNRTLFARRTQKFSYLDLGCGPNLTPEFCNLNYDWWPGLDLCWDATRGLPFSSGQLRGIFTEHMLEHIPFTNALALLAECRRVLRKEGTLRIVIPDGELYLSEYAKHIDGRIAHLPYADSDKSYYEIVTPIVSVNRIFRHHGHQFIWDYETLRLALLRAGFTNVVKCAFGQGSDRMLLRDSPGREVESLYVEAT
jgi:predicted SAM-dependent methyltransferase